MGFLDRFTDRFTAPRDKDFVRSLGVSLLRSSGLKDGPLELAKKTAFDRSNPAGIVAILDRLGSASQEGSRKATKINDDTAVNFLNAVKVRADELIAVLQSGAEIEQVDPKVEELRNAMFDAAWLCTGIM